MFANRSEEEEIYPLTAQEVADAQRVDATIKHCFKSNHVFDKDFNIRLVDETSVVGVVQANVGQKLLNSNMLRVFSYRS